MYMWELQKLFIAKFCIYKYAYLISSLVTLFLYKFELIWTQLNDFKYCNQTLVILCNINIHRVK